MYEVMNIKQPGKILYRYTDGWYETHLGFIIKGHPMQQTFPVIKETEKQNLEYRGFLDSMTKD